MIDLDIKAVARMTRLFVPRMRAEGWGRILLTASIGAYSPTPLYATYCAAKAFVLSYGIAIREELKGTGISLTVLSPGVTRTEFHAVAGHESNPWKRATMMEPEPVVRAALKGLFRGKAEVVPGLSNKLMALSTRFISRPVQAGFAALMMRPTH